MTHDDWADLIEEISLGKCILVLGPEISTVQADGEEELLTRILAKSLKEKLDSQAQSLQRWDLAHTSKVYSTKKSPVSLRREIREFYRTQLPEVSEMHSHLASLPFNLIINATPDERITQALIQEGKEPLESYYNFHGDKRDFINWDPLKHPLVYYLYGSIKNPESLVITENDLLEFLVSIITKDPALPSNISSEFRDKHNCFLFLGFGFKNWYLRILLYVLLGGKEKKAKEGPSFALEDFTIVPEDAFMNNSIFYREEHKIIFSKMELPDFIEELKERYTKVAGPSAELKRSKPVRKDLKAPTVFICHASEDRERASVLYEQLKGAGIDPWIDTENIRGGDRWGQVIKRTIDEIDYFVVLQSKSLASKSKGFLNKEIHYALDRQLEFRAPLRFIIPVIIEPSELLKDLDFTQAIDLTSREVDELIKVIKLDQKYIAETM